MAPCQAGQRTSLGTKARRGVTARCPERREPGGDQGRKNARRHQAGDLAGAETGCPNRHGHWTQSRRQGATPDAQNAVTMTVNQIDGNTSKPSGSPFTAAPEEEEEASKPKAKAKKVEAEEVEEPQVRTAKKVEAKDVAKVLDDWADDGDE